MRTQQSSTFRALVAIATCALTTLACGGGQPADRAASAPPGSTASAGRPAASGLATTSTVETCAGFGATAAAEFLGIAATAVVDQSQELTPTLRTCTFTSREDATKVISFSVGIEETAEDAARSYAQMKDNIPLASNVQKAAGADAGDSPLIEIGGLGDEALWTNVNGALTVRRGNLTIQVMAPPDRKKQVAIADKILALAH